MVVTVASSNIKISAPQMRSGEYLTMAIGKASSRQPESGVALRINLIGQRCCGESLGKARFVCNGPALIVEDLVLRRWRHRTGSDETFHGCRLPPRTWDIARACFAGGFSVESDTDVESLEQSLAEVRKVHRLWKAPAATHFLTLLRFLKERGVLQTILDRPREFARPGLPDLALYRRGSDGCVYGFIFVEVKRSVGRWRERLSSAQSAELQFLRSLGLKAGVVRLIEHK